MGAKIDRGTFHADRPSFRLSSLPCKAKQALDCFSENVWAQTSTRLASRSVRGLKQVLDWLRAVCAASNKYSIGFAHTARPETSTRLASRTLRGPKQALDWGGCGRQRSLAGYKANPTSFLYQAYFPGLGRGRPPAKSGLLRDKIPPHHVPSILPRPRRRPARPQTGTRPASHSGPDKQRNSGANKRLQQTVNRREFDERMRYPYS